MIKIAKFFTSRLNCYAQESVIYRNITLAIYFSIGFFTSVESQTYFSPNTKVVINQQKSDAFIKGTPEISLKADYYNISKPVLETVLILQSNGGTITSDGRYNYGSVKVHPELTAYPAFSKSKNGFIICTTRSRGVEATALSLSLLRNASKNTLSDSQWLSLVFGQNGDLNSLAHQADEIYTSRTGKSFVQLGIQLDNMMAVSDMVKSNDKERNDADLKFESTNKVPKNDEIKVQNPEVPAQQDTERKPFDQTLPPVPIKKEEIVQTPLPELENENVIKPSQELSNLKPADTVGAKKEVILPKDEPKTVVEMEPNSSVKIENSKNPSLNQLITDDPKPRTSNSNNEKPKPILIPSKTDESALNSVTTNSNAEKSKVSSPPADDPNPIIASKVENTKVTNSTTQPNNVQQNKNSLYQTDTYKPKHGRSAWSLYGGLKIFDMEKNPREMTLIYVDESPSRDNINSSVTVEGNQAYHVGIRYQNNRDDVSFRFLLDGQGYFGSINGLALGLGGVFRLNDKGGFIIQPEITGVIGYGAKGIGTIQNNDTYIMVNDTKFQDYTNVNVSVENYFVGIKSGLSFSFRTGYKSEIGIGASYQLSYKKGSVTFSGKDASDKSVSDSENLTEPNVNFFVNGFRTDKVPFNPDGLEFKLFYAF